MSYKSLWESEVKIETLVGETIDRIEGLVKDSDEVRIFTKSGKEFLFYHEQDCCESVNLNDFDGDPEDLKGALIVSAEEVSNSDDEDNKPDDYSESWTWTFYKIETNKGGIWMRWLGESNGYYSESVTLAWVNQPDDEL
jgi:hypothetical protein